MTPVAVDPTLVSVLAAVVTVALVAWSAVALMALLRRHGAVDLALIGAPILLVAGWAVIIEALSATVGISRGTLTAAAVGLGALALAGVGHWWAGARTLMADGRRVWASVRSVLATPTWWRWPLLVAVALAFVVVAVSLVVAAITPPNNPDSLAYHLPRVMWWLQQGHVGSYVAPDPRELAFPPLNSYLLLIAMGVSGSDLIVNLVEWLCALLAALGTILIGRRVGMGKVALLVAGVLAVTIPTGITVSTTTKADWLAALWPVLAVAIVMSRSRGRMSLPWTAVLLGTAAALAAATKPTSAATVALTVVLGVWWEIRPPAGRASETSSWAHRIRDAVIVALAGGVGALAGFVPQALRTAAIYGNATGPDLDIVVAHPTASILWANTMRTLLNNIGVPPPLSESINPRLPDLLPLIGVPIRDDAALHFDAVLQLLIGRNEDFATNPIHLILGLAACAVALVSRRAPSRLRYLAGLVLASFLLLVGTLQWNLWTSRFLLSVLVLGSLPLGWLLARGLESRTGRPSPVGALSVVVVLAAAIYGFAISVAQEYRPLVGSGSILTTSRLDQYFAVNDRPGTSGLMQEKVVSQARRLSALPEGSRIGLIGVGPQEYLVWRLLNPDGRYTFVNLEGPDGPATVDLDTLDGIVCIDKCPSGAGAG